MRNLLVLVALLGALALGGAQPVLAEPPPASETPRPELTWAFTRTGADAVVRPAFAPEAWVLYARCSDGDPRPRCLYDYRLPAADGRAVFPFRRNVLVYGLAFEVCAWWADPDDRRVIAEERCWGYHTPPIPRAYLPVVAVGVP